MTPRKSRTKTAQTFDGTTLLPVPTPPINLHDMESVRREMARVPQQGELLLPPHRLVTGGISNDFGSPGNREVVLEPVPGVASQLKCRGQVLASTKVVTYEVSIKEIGYGPEPYVIADALMYADGKPIANRVQPGKRPRSSMSPTILLRDGKVALVLGSPEFQRR